jgi:hypothetical protein
MKHPIITGAFSIHFYINSEKYHCTSNIVIQVSGFFLKIMTGTLSTRNKLIQIRNIMAMLCGKMFCPKRMKMSVK